MTGTFLVLFGGIFLICMLIIVLASFFDWDLWEVEDFLVGVTLVSGLIFIFLLIVIPISRLDSKTNVEKIKQFQITLDSSRENLSDFERLKVIEDINASNSRISNWKIKGNKWYHNKWYYHPSTRNVEYIK